MYFCTFDFVINLKKSIVVGWVYRVSDSENVVRMDMESVRELVANFIMLPRFLDF